MTITPQEIQSKQFNVRFRGFDVDEVDKFLEQVVESYAYMIEENKLLNSELSSLRREVESIRGEESSFRSALITAQKVADEMKVKSRQEADQMLVEARAEMGRLRDEAHREVAALERQVDELKGMRSRIFQELRGVVSRYMAMIDAQMENEPPPGDAASVVHGRGHSASANPTESAPVDDGRHELFEKIDLGDVPIGMAESESGDDREKHSASSSGPRLESAIDLFTLEDPLDSEGGVDLPIQGGDKP